MTLDGAFSVRYVIILLLCWFVLFLFKVGLSLYIVFYFPPHACLGLVHFHRLCCQIALISLD